MRTDLRPLEHRFEARKPPRGELSLVPEDDSSNPAERAASTTTRRDYTSCSDIEFDSDQMPEASTLEPARAAFAAAIAEKPSGRCEAPPGGRRDERREDRCYGAGRP
jgi:hypothetical protein